LLSQARIIEEDETHDSVQIGAKVTIQEDGFDPETYVVVGAAEANPREGRISNESPLGKALFGHREGEKVNVEAPSGSFEVTIVLVE
jgi:transcription elongation factor GreA